MLGIEVPVPQIIHDVVGGGAKAKGNERFERSDEDRTVVDPMRHQRRDQDEEIFDPMRKACLCDEET
jgi:hypothetical protein